MSTQPSKSSPSRSESQAGRRKMFATGAIGLRAMTAMAVAVLVGCNGWNASPAPPGYLPGWAEAKQSLETALGAWRDAPMPPPDPIETSGVIFVDKQRRPGQRLRSFAILGQSELEERPAVHGSIATRPGGVAPARPLQCPGAKPGLGLPPGGLRADFPLGTPDGRALGRDRDRPGREIGLVAETSSRSILATATRSRTGRFARPAFRHQTSVSIPAHGPQAAPTSPPAADAPSTPWSSRRWRIRA